jgi:hypothetical protein
MIMKKLFFTLTFLSLFFPSVLKAQYPEFNYNPDTTYLCFHYLWHGYVEGFHNHGTAFAYELFTYNQYTKNGKTYYSVVQYADSKDAAYLILLPGPTVIMGIRMENGRVYVDKQEYIAAMEKEYQDVLEEQKLELNPLGTVGDRDYLPYRQTDDGELILYDFNMQPGDKYLSIEGHEDISVVRVETMVTRDGVSRRLLTLSNGYQLLEGVGCLNSPGMFFYYLNPSETMTRYYASNAMTRCYSFGKDGTDIYYQGDETTDIDNIGISSTTASSLFYDLRGCRIYGTPRPGIYIRQGKTLIAR